MPDSDSSKDDAAAQKAYETAVAAKSDSKAQPAAEPVKAEAKAEAAPAPKAAAAKPVARKSAPAKAAPKPAVAVAKKPAASTPVKAEAATKPAKKTVAKKAPAKKAAPAKATTKKTTLKKTLTNSADAARVAKPKTKDTTMATKTATKNIATDMAAEMQTRLAGMYEKGTEMTGEMVTFQRANAEAMAEAGKILFTGMQDLTREAVEETRKVADQFGEDARLMAAAKSPTELVKLQGDIMRRSFDHAVATGSKNTEAWIKLTNEAFAPLSSRVSETVDKMNKLAA